MTFNGKQTEPRYASYRGSGSFVDELGLSRAAGLDRGARGSGADAGRSDPPMAGPICAHRYRENWNFDPKTHARAFGGITLAFRSKSRLQVGWHKPLLVNGATLTSDGLAADGVLENVDSRQLGDYGPSIRGFAARVEDGVIVVRNDVLMFKATCGIRPMAKNKMRPPLAQVLKVNNSPPWRHSPQR